MPTLLTQAELAKSLSIPDLTDSNVTPDHALQKLIHLAQVALKNHWQGAIQTIRTSPMVPVENNYDRLNYPKYGAARDARYTRYITPRYILRTQTSSAIPDALAGLNGQPPVDLLLMLPGLVYRRDSIDRLHCAEPHQLDLWRVVDHRQHRMMTEADLQDMISVVISALLPGHQWRTVPSPHPYTRQGVQIDVWWQEQWIEVGECGLIEPSILNNAGLILHSGLAMGLGLDRLLMIRKGIDDIRLIRHSDPRVQSQMQDLAAYKPVSMMPAIERDLSLVTSVDTDIEMMGDILRHHYPHSDVIESLSIISETGFQQLPEAARQRLALSQDQKNVLLRLVIRAMDRTLTAEEANEVRNAVYQLLHQGVYQEVALSRK
jgi:phenylalanyl-tRNA synthetase alpha chain